MSDAPGNGSGWRLPTPHEVFGAIIIVCEAMRASNACMPGTACDRVLGVLTMAFAIAGISSARMYLSPRVKGLLDRRDETKG